MNPGSPLYTVVIPVVFALTTMSVLAYPTAKMIVEDRYEVVGGGWTKETVTERYEPRDGIGAPTWVRKNSRKEGGSGLGTPPVSEKTTLPTAIADPKLGDRRAVVHINYHLEVHNPWTDRRQRCSLFDKHHFWVKYGIGAPVRPRETLRSGNEDLPLCSLDP